MGKRSEFERIQKDAYQTIDPKAVEPLKTYLNTESLRYYEPCVGEGKLLDLLDPWHCSGNSDDERDARTFQYGKAIANADYFITNPPWNRELLHPIIENLRRQLPTWLLFDADWMHTKQSSEYMRHCRTILSVGRLTWIPGTKVKGKDNCAWYLFDDYETDTQFVGR